jgi:predicted O-linked N-acetylglucosamine transferase (SPINDLY family)
MDFEAHVRFVPWLSQAAFFGLLQRAEVVLDTVGFSGFNTAMQAVECGAPMVAWDGRFLRGRFASGILRAMQLQEWIADTHEAYVEKVARLTGDAALRQQVRAQIGERRKALYDDKASVDALAALLEKLAA